MQDVGRDFRAEIDASAKDGQRLPPELSLEIMETLAASDQRRTLLRLMLACRGYFALGELHLLRDISLPHNDERGVVAAFKSALETALAVKSTRFEHT